MEVIIGVYAREGAHVAIVNQRFVARVLGGAGHAKGPVLVRDAHEEARRVDAALGGEADEAAGSLVPMRGRDHEHRVIEPARDVLEALLYLGIDGHGIT